METFYFTYGLEGQPFVGGWTEIVAPDEITAITVFRAFHPDKFEGFLNCASFYHEKKFVGTNMYKDGNFGARRHERITVIVEKFDE